MNKRYPLLIVTVLLVSISFISSCGKPSVDELINKLGKNVNTSGKAITELGNIGEPAVKPLIAILDDEQKRFNAASALGRIGRPAIEPLIESFKDDKKREAAIFAFREMGEEAVEPLIIAMSDEDPGIREGAASVLVDKKDKRTLEPYIKALKDQNPKVRKEAAWGLGILKDKKAVDPLIAALNDSDQEVLDKVTFALGNINEPKAIDPLVGYLEKQKDPKKSAEDFKNSPLNILTKAADKWASKHGYIFKEKQPWEKD